MADFAAQAAKHRVDSFATRIRPAESGQREFDVFLGAIRSQVELTDHGPATLDRAQLRVRLTTAWTPKKDGEFTVARTGDRFRINAVASHPSSAEWVCDCVKIST